MEVSNLRVPLIIANKLPREQLYMNFNAINDSPFQLENLWDKKCLSFSPKVKKKLKPSDGHGRWCWNEGLS